MLLQELRNAILADGVIDSDEVALLESELYTDGVINHDRAPILFEIVESISGNENSPEWEDFFIRAVTDYLLTNEDNPGIINEEGVKFITDMLGRVDDGGIDDTERLMLENINKDTFGLPLNVMEKISKIPL